jgi:hypothetical protein
VQAAERYLEKLQKIRAELAADEIDPDKLVPLKNQLAEYEKKV